jgi:hypothetical protein
MKSTPSQLNMHYGGCPKKIESRYQTIIKAYQNHYNLNTIPKDSQYWSICGRCSYEFGKLEDNCEPDQMIKSGLVKPNQIHGIEIDKEIFKYNQKAHKGINWHIGDFYEIMVEYANNNYFNPAIVNSDMLLMPKLGVQYLSKIMQFLTTSANQVMLVGNFVSEHRHFRFGIEDIIDGMEKEPCFQCSMNMANWEFNKEYYWYNGTGKTTTKMMTIILFKQQMCLYNKVKKED